MKKILGKQRVNSYFTNSGNWVEKQKIASLLSSRGCSNYNDQFGFIRMFCNDVGGREMKFREVVWDYWDLFVHFVNNTDF